MWLQRKDTKKVFLSSVRPGRTGFWKTGFARAQSKKPVFSALADKKCPLFSLQKACDASLRSREGAGEEGEKEEEEEEARGGG